MIKSIGSRIIVSFGVLILIVCLGLGVVSYFISSSALTDVLNETMPKFALEASLTIEDSIRNQLNVLSLVASSDALGYPQRWIYQHLFQLWMQRQKIGHGGSADRQEREGHIQHGRNCGLKDGPCLK